MTGVTDSSVANRQTKTIELPLSMKGSSSQAPSACAACKVKECRSSRR